MRDQEDQTVPLWLVKSPPWSMNYKTNERNGFMSGIRWTYAWNDTVELASLVTETVLTGGKLTEVLGGFGNDVIEKFEGYPTSGLLV